MLNSHKDIAIPLESLFVIDYLLSEDLEKVKRLVQREYEISEWGLDIDKKNLEDISSTKELITYLHKRYAKKSGASLWGQKTPRFVRHWKLLKETFPNSKFIHLVRDPRAVCNSLKNSDVHQSNMFYAVRRWKYDVQNGLDMETSLDDVLRVSYEDLVQNPEGTLREITEFLNIDYNPNMLSYHEAGTEEYTSYYENIHSNLKEKPKISRITAWQKELRKEEISYVEDQCEFLMKILGYESITEKKYPSFLPLFWWFQRLYLLCKQIMKYLLERPGYIYSFFRRKLSLTKARLPDINK